MLRRDDPTLIGLVPSGAIDLAKVLAQVESMQLAIDAYAAALPGYLAASAAIRSRAPPTPAASARE